MLLLIFPQGKPIGKPGRERSPLHINQGLSLARESYLLTQNSGTISGAVCQRTGVLPNQSSSGEKISEPPEPAHGLQPLTPRQPVGGKSRGPWSPPAHGPPQSLSQPLLLSSKSREKEEDAEPHVGGSHARRSQELEHFRCPQLRSISSEYQG